MHDNRTDQNNTAIYQKNIERRCKIDIWVKTLNLVNFLAWILIVVILVVFERARPQFESFFDRFYKLKLRVNWDMKFIDYLIWLVAVCIIISISGLLLGLARARREEDCSTVGLLIMGLISLGFLIGVELFVL